MSGTNSWRGKILKIEISTIGKNVAISVITNIDTPVYHEVVLINMEIINDWLTTANLNS